MVLNIIIIKYVLRSDFDHMYVRRVVFVGTWSKTHPYGFHVQRCLVEWYIKTEVGDILDAMDEQAVHQHEEIQEVWKQLKIAIGHMIHKTKQLIIINDAAPGGEGDAYRFLAINPAYGNDENNDTESGAVPEEAFTLPIRRGINLNASQSFTISGLVKTNKVRCTTQKTSSILTIYT